MQQQLIDKLRTELEQLKAKNFEMAQLEYMQGNNAGTLQAAHGEKLKEVYEKQLKMKLEELQEKDRVIANKQEEILALELELDIIKTQREKEHLLIEQNNLSMHSGHPSQMQNLSQDHHHSHSA